MKHKLQFELLSYVFENYHVLYINENCLVCNTEDFLICPSSGFMDCSPILMLFPGPVSPEGSAGSAR